MQRRAGLSGRVPSGHHHHLSRLKPAEIDPLSEYGLPSKGEKRLLSTKTQESYYAKIAERYLALCTEAGDRDALLKQFSRPAIADRADDSPPPPSWPRLPSLPPSRVPSPALSSSPPQQQNGKLSHRKPGPGDTPLVTTPSAHQSYTQPHPHPSASVSQILSALRKLREGIVASKRRDDFAVQVYLFAIRLGIQTSSYETYQPALLYLLRAIHPRHNLTRVELQEAAGYLVLDTACRRGDLAEAFTLRNKYYGGGGGVGCGGGNGGGTGGRVGGGGGGGGGGERGDGGSGGESENEEATSAARVAPGPFDSSGGLVRQGRVPRDAKVDAVLRALVRDDWVLWRRLKKSVDGHKARIMDFAEPQLRAHVLKAFGRAYLSVPLPVLEAQTGESWAELQDKHGVGWELSNGKVEIRKIRGRT